MTDAHYSSYAELLEKVQWEQIRRRQRVAKDSRCEIAWSLRLRSDREPGPQRAAGRHVGDVRFNFGAKPNQLVWATKSLLSTASPLR